MHRALPGVVELPAHRVAHACAWIPLPCIILGGECHSPTRIVGESGVSAPAEAPSRQTEHAPNPSRALRS